MGLTFEWDREKDAVNRTKHSVSFQEACEVFFDPFNLTIPDPDHSVEEERFVLLGFGAGKLLVVNFTERGDAIRIISSRRANAKERIQGFMSKKAEGNQAEHDPMRSHYDFAKSVQGKYRHLIGQAYTRKVYHADGATTVEQVEPAQGVVVLAPDVREYFPDSEAVNKALRGLIELIRQTRQEKTSSESR